LTNKGRIVRFRKTEGKIKERGISTRGKKTQLTEGKLGREVGLAAQAQIMNRGGSVVNPGEGLPPEKKQSSCGSEK